MSAGTCVASKLNYRSDKHMNTKMEKKNKIYSTRREESYHIITQKTPCSESDQFTYFTSGEQIHLHYFNIVLLPFLKQKKTTKKTKQETIITRQYRVVGK